MKKEVIVIGGGCFWCTEAVFKMLKGVLSIEPGYAGGNTKNPTYKEVCSGITGHAEVIKIEYNVEEIALETLLTVFFATHDPTTPNRQGNDVGEQYRSIILCDNSEQEKISQKFIEDLNQSSEMGSPVVTEVKMLATAVGGVPSEGGNIFYPAEDYHKNYYERNKSQPYCQVIINPKLAKVQGNFAKFLKENRS